MWQKYLWRSSVLVWRKDLRSYRVHLNTFYQKKWFYIHSSTTKQSPVNGSGYEYICRVWPSGLERGRTNPIREYKPEPHLSHTFDKMEILMPSAMIMETKNQQIHIKDLFNSCHGLSDSKRRSWFWPKEERGNCRLTWQLVTQGLQWLILSNDSTE